MLDDVELVWESSSVSPSVSPSISPSPSLSLSTSPSVSPSHSPSHSPSRSASPSQSPSRSASRSASPSVSSSASPSTPPSSPPGYYVSTTGNDESAGTFENPWRTISYGITQLTAGDTLYIRGGTYVESIEENTSGTAVNPITISGYNGETAIIDGEYTLPGGSVYNFFVQINGNYVTLRDITLMRSSGGLLIMTGDYDNGINITGNGSRESGLILSGTGSVFDGCSMTDNGNGYGIGGQGTWGGAIATVGYSTTIQNCLSHDNMGEGLATYSDSTDSIIQDSISYNNQSALIYLDSVRGAICRRNIAYRTDSNGYGIVVAHETTYNPTDLLICNNLAMGSWCNFLVDCNLTNTIDLNNTRILYNTFVNSTGDNDDGYNMNVYFRPTGNSYTNSIYKDNIVLEEGAGKIPVYVPASHPGLTFSYNLWSSAPMAGASGVGDVVDNPDLAKTGPTGPGQLTANYFKLLVTSPAIGAANPNAEVLQDYWNTNRDANYPDIGAHEYT
jgi:hypothetical protein